MTVTSDKSTSTTHVLHLSAVVPDNLPGGHYEIQAQVPRVGYSNPVNITVPYNITGMSPSSGSTAGGQLVTISGNGFAADVSAISVLIAGVPCAVQSATATTIECKTGPVETISAGRRLLSGSNNSAPAVLQVQVSAFAPMVSVENVVYSYAEGPVVDSVTPTRGSSAGGTAVVIKGTGFSDDVLSVAMADTPCTEIQFVSSSEIRCETID